MTRNTWLILTILVISAVSYQFIPPPKEKINWITVQERNELYKKEPRPILVDVYTTWCGWCKVMDKKTYTNDNLANYINKRFYAIKLNAETKESFNFNNKTYAYDGKNNISELADYLLFGRLEFPTTVFLSSMDAKPAPLSGYLKPSEMEAPLKYFGEKAFQSQTFVEFKKVMKSEW